MVTELVVVEGSVAADLEVAAVVKFACEGRLDLFHRGISLISAAVSWLAMTALVVVKARVRTDLEVAGVVTFAGEGRLALFRDGISINSVSWLVITVLLMAEARVAEDLEVAGVVTFLPAAEVAVRVVFFTHLHEGHLNFFRLQRRIK